MLHQGLFMYFPYCNVACMANLSDEEDLTSGKDSNAIITSMAPGTVDLNRNERELSVIQLENFKRYLRLVHTSKKTFIALARTC